QPLDLIQAWSSAPRPGNAVAERRRGAERRTTPEVIESAGDSDSTSSIGSNGRATLARGEFDEIAKLPQGPGPVIRWKPPSQGRFFFPPPPTPPLPRQGGARKNEPALPPQVGPWHVRRRDCIMSGRFKPRPAAASPRGREANGEKHDNPPRCSNRDRFPQY